MPADTSSSFDRVAWAESVVALNGILRTESSLVVQWSMAVAITGRKTRNL